jgi:hypothetical protein
LLVNFVSQYLYFSAAGTFPAVNQFACTTEEIITVAYESGFRGVVIVTSFIHELAIQECWILVRNAKFPVKSVKLKDKKKWAKQF